MVGRKKGGYIANATFVPCLQVSDNQCILCIFAFGIVRSVFVYGHPWQGRGGRDRFRLAAQAVSHLVRNTF